MKVGLIPCCKEKAPTGRAAASLYRSQFFRMAMRYVQRECDAWAILSGKHGLVMPWQRVEPYDLNLNDQDAAYVRAWARRTGHHIRRRWPNATFVVLAKREYLTAVEGLRTVHPLRGLSALRSLTRLSELNGGTK